MLNRLAGVTGIIPTRVITAARMLPYGCAAAWYAITDKESVGKWINTAESWDARQGGLWKLNSPSGAVGTGWFTQVKEMAELSFSWNWVAPKLAPTHCTIRLEETEDGTLISVYHHGWGFGELWDHEIADCKNGWNMCLTSLAALGK